MVAVGDTLTSFTKLSGWEIAPDSSLGQKNDFRDPQAYYDPDTGIISLTITASQGNVARILKYSVTANLETANYDGIIFSNPVGDFWNLECTDTFQMGDTWYVTYSAQDDTLWYASSENRYGPYSEPQRLEGKLFYSPSGIPQARRQSEISTIRSEPNMEKAKRMQAGWT